MSGDEAAAPVVPPVAEPAAIPEDMDLLAALELTLRKARAYGGVIRGLHESAKLIEKRVVQLYVLAEDCNQPDYVKLVKESICHLSPNTIITNYSGLQARYMGVMMRWSLENIKQKRHWIKVYRVSSTNRWRTK